MRLYVAGLTPPIRGCAHQSETHLEEQYEIDNERRAGGMEDKPREFEALVAVPTPIKKLPFPPHRFVGDMSNTERIVIGLNLEYEDGRN